MIETIIKRDGRVEPFDANKINGWGEWASDNLGDSVNWSDVILSVIATLPAQCEASELQSALIRFCLDKGEWNYAKMAGRLYASTFTKEIYGKGKHPTLLQVHKTMIKDNIIRKLNYSTEEYQELNKVIDHTRDLESTYAKLYQARNKYALKNRATGKEYETPGFVYMRIAMSLGEMLPDNIRLHDVKKWYYYLSNNKLNAPTPYFTNLATELCNVASCCVYTVGDNAKSLATGDHIAYMMTVNSAGIGAHLLTRSIGDPVRGGIIQHAGKIPYYKSLVSATKANLQNGRGGAVTIHFPFFDPEIENLIVLKNPMTPTVSQIRGGDYSFQANSYFMEKVMNGEHIYTISYLDAPKVYEYFYSNKLDKFKLEYDKFVEENPEKCKKINARQLLSKVLKESLETGRMYIHNVDNANIHTPFKDPIYQSNLCQEISIATKPYNSVEGLYDADNEIGEIGLCSLSGIVVSNIESDEEYAECAYYALKMVDMGIQMSVYPFAHLQKTARARMNAGVGILGLAHLMAREKLSYASQAGRDRIHEIFETHAWHLYNASLKLCVELGYPEYMTTKHTKLADGWVPLDTYNKEVDNLVTIENKRDWNDLKQRIKRNGGIRHSVVSAMMPAESSSITCETTNGVYPIRRLSLTKTNNSMNVTWVAPETEELANYYESAWDIDNKDLIKCYAIMQKWTDQGISADLYIKRNQTESVKISNLMSEYLLMMKLGLKSRYYYNTMMSSGTIHTLSNQSEIGCESGGCTL